MIKLLIIGDNYILSELLHQYLSSREEISVLERLRFDEIEQPCRFNELPHIILFLWGNDPLHLRRKFSSLKKQFPGARIIFLSSEDKREEAELNIIKMGAKGFLCAKDSLETLIRAIKACHAGEIWASRKSTNAVIGNLDTGRVVIEENETGGLTPREKEVLLLLASGLKNTEIAARLFISDKTVKTHVSRLFKKIKVSNRLQATLWAYKNFIKKEDQAPARHKKHNS